MSTGEIEAWFHDHPGILIYICLLMAGSLISFITLVSTISKANRLRRYPVPPWPLSSLDFALFVIALLLWFILSGLILLQVQDWIFGDNHEQRTEFAVLGGFLLQTGMLYLFFRFKFHHRSPNEGPINPRLISIGQSMLQGLYYFLACLPVVYGVSLAWNGLLEVARQKGFDIDLPIQDAVQILQETDSAVTFYGILFLAVVIAPIVEETVFRAGIYRFLKGKTSMFLALFLSGLLFGLIHGNLQSLPGLVAVGICLGMAYELSGNLRVAVFFHAFFNLNSVVWILILPEGMG